MLDINCGNDDFWGDFCGDHDGDLEVVYRAGHAPPDSGDCDGADIAPDNDTDAGARPFVDAWGNTWEPET